MRLSPGILRRVCRSTTRRIAALDSHPGTASSMNYDGRVRSFTFWSWPCPLWAPRRVVSHAFGISALLLSLIIIPIATELPEKVNSILWIRRKKDTLAFGNITGAMVFQGTLLPAIGIMLTPWEPRVEVLTGVIITLIAATWLRISARAHGLDVWALLMNGMFYMSYLFITLRR
jgi:Ca2+/Na+ antiporter